MSQLSQQSHKTKYDWIGGAPVVSDETIFDWIAGAIRVVYEYTAVPPPAGWMKLAYASEPPTPAAWNQLKREAGTGWRKLLYEGE